MGSSALNICCGKLLLIKNKEFLLDSSDTPNSEPNIILIQSAFRGYIYRKKNKDYISVSIGSLHRNNINSSSSNNKLNTLSNYNISNNHKNNYSNLKEVSLTISTDMHDQNPKIQQLKNLLPKFELDEKESYYLNTSKLQTKAFIYPDGSIYKGTINNLCKREGYGKFYLPDGSIYEGFFKDNKMEGRGRILNIDGFVYDGEFKNSLACGYGKYLDLNGTVYKGKWDKDKQNGVGDEVYSDGSHYVGDFEEGKKNGHGTFYFPEGNFYDGEFKNNEIFGVGLYKWKDGRCYMGEWSKNKMNGWGVFIWPDKKKYYGHYTSNSKDGFGIFYWIDGKKYEGFWKRGKMSGIGKIIFGGIDVYGKWEDGKKLLTIDDDKEIEKINNSIIEEKNDKEFIDFYGKIGQYEDEINKYCQQT